MKREPIKLLRPLVKGDVIYNNLGMDHFVWYRYLCPMPLKSGADCDAYFILIDCRTETPIRMYIKELNDILEKNLNSLEDVKQLQIRLTEKHLEYLRKEKM